LVATTELFFSMRVLVSSMPCGQEGERGCVFVAFVGKHERERERDHFSKCLSARGRCLQYAITLQMFHLLFVTNDDRRSLRLRLLIDFISSNAAALPSFSPIRDYFTLLNHSCDAANCTTFLTLPLFPKVNLVTLQI